MAQEPLFEMTGRLHDPSTLAAVEQAIARLPGVRAARAVAGYEREIDELHVLADPSATPKALVRDLQTLLLTQFDLPLDHRVVSIVTLPSLPGDGVPSVHRPRLRLREVGVRSTSDARAVTVTVADHGDLSHSGEASAMSLPAHRRLACARATVAAVAAWLPDHVQLEVVEVQHLQTVAGATVLVVLIWGDRRAGTTTLSGSAVVADDEDVAVARATLDALNRPLHRL